MVSEGLVASGIPGLERWGQEDQELESASVGSSEVGQVEGQGSLSPFFLWKHFCQRLHTVPPQAGEMAQRIKLLLHKQENLSSDAQSPHMPCGHGIYL